MSLQAKILSLISGISDTVVRVDVASTINFLYEVYASGRAKGEEVRRELYAVCSDVVSGVHPELSEEELLNMDIDELWRRIEKAFGVNDIRRTDLHNEEQIRKYEELLAERGVPIP